MNTVAACTCLVITKGSKTKLGGYLTGEYPLCQILGLWASEDSPKLRVTRQLRPPGITSGRMKRQEGNKMV